ncbi:MAG: hypothetical protein FJ296_07255, partial [Planctomycetes bacterium]|nr:hypothetical protein [Planctomycetota bacterium]
MPASYRAALGALTGRVLLADGQPLPGLPIELLGGRRSLIIRSTTAFLDPDGLQFDPVVGRTQTDAEGRFRLSDLQPRTVGLLLLDPGGPRSLLWPLEITPVAGETRDLGDLVLPLTATLVGRVVDARNQPLPGARVRATEIPGIELAPEVANFREGGGVMVMDTGSDESFAWVPPPAMSALVAKLPVPTAYTDADGRFELPGVQPGLVTLAIDEPRHLVHVQGGVPTGAAGAVRDIGTIGLGDGELARGRVVDGKGQPVAGAEVLLGSPLGLVPGAVLRGPHVSDADGAFSVPGFRAGAVWAVARADAQHDWTLTSHLQAGVPGEIRLDLPRSATLLVHAGDRVPLEDVELWGRATPDDDVVDLFLPPQRLADVSRDEQGRHVIANLRPAEWEFVVRAPGRPPERAELDLRDGDGADEVVLRAGHALAVRVLGPDGQPLEWAQVEVAEEEMDFEDPPLAVGRTAADGRVRLENLPAEKVYVTATHPGYAIATDNADLAPQADGTPAPELVLSLQAGGSVLGQVVDGGLPPAEPLLAILINTDSPGDALLPVVAVTDLEGRFRFDRVEPGEAHVEVRSRTNFTSGLTFFEAFIESALAEEEVEVLPEGETRVLLDIGAQLAGRDTGTVAGSLLVNGLPADGWRVRTWGEIRRSVKTDARGQFDLGRLPAEPFELSLSPPGAGLEEGFTDRMDVELATGERKWLELKISTGSLSGLVRSAATGQPLPGARVQVVAEEQEGRGGRLNATVTGADGRYKLEPVAAGRYRLNVRAPDHANFNGEPFELHEAQARTGVDVSVPRGLRLSGKVVVQCEEQPKWAWLIATAEDDITRDTANVDSETMTFEFDGLSPGDWAFELATDLDLELAEVKLRVDTDRSGVELAFEAAPEAPPEDEGQDGVTIEVKSSGG